MTQCLFNEGMAIKKNSNTLKKLKFNKKILYISVGIFVVWFVTSPFNVSRTDKSWIEPARHESESGLLDITLTAEKSKVNIGGEEKQSFVYNGQYPGQTLVVKGGDTLKVKLENKINEDTNLHFHGGHVSPKGNSDNVLVKVEPGETFDYEYSLPDDHPPGLYWYHPHWHGFTEDQVGGGMAGAIIIKGDIDELPGVKGVPERLLVLTTQNRTDNNPNEPTRLVNGVKDPILTIRPGEIQRWRILNASSDDFYNFNLSDLPFHIISRDGNTTSVPIEQKEELMAPGDRIEILVRGPKRGSYAVKSLPFNEGFSNYVESDFMTLKSGGLPVFGGRIPTELLPVEDLSKVEIDNTRTLTFTIGGSDDNPVFLINGKPFDSSRVDQLITLGDTEEWILENPSDEWHPFHIHINPFQVIEVNGEKVDRQGYDDTFGIPRKGSIKIRTKYKDFDGKFVLHCHILFHEDNGMMQLVRIVDPEKPEESINNSEFDELHKHEGNKTNDFRGSRVDAL